MIYYITAILCGMFVIPWCVGTLVTVQKLNENKWGDRRKHKPQ
jgi:hypothetical protein